VNEAASNLVLDDAILLRVLNDSFKGVMDLNPQCIAEASLSCVVVVCGAVQIFCYCRVVLDPHFLAVRRRNSLCEIGLTFPDSMSWSRADATFKPSGSSVRSVAKAGSAIRLSQADKAK